MICELEAICMNKYACDRCSNCHESHFVKVEWYDSRIESCLNCVNAGEFALDGDCADCRVTMLDMFFADKSKVISLMRKLREIEGLAM